MIQFLEVTSVAAIGTTPLTRNSTGQESLVLNVYNANGSSRNVTVTAGAVVFSFAMTPGTSRSVTLIREGNLSIVSDGTGVFGWIGKAG